MGICDFKIVIPCWWTYKKGCMYFTHINKLLLSVCMIQYVYNSKDTMTKYTGLANSLHRCGQQRCRICWKFRISGNSVRKMKKNSDLLPLALMNETLICYAELIASWTTKHTLHGRNHWASPSIFILSNSVSYASIAATQWMSCEFECHTACHLHTVIYAWKCTD